MDGATERVGGREDEHGRVGQHRRRLVAQVLLLGGGGRGRAGGGLLGGAALGLLFPAAAGKESVRNGYGARANAASWLAINLGSLHEN